MKWFSFLLLLLLSMKASAQPETGLVAYFAFDDGTVAESRNNQNILETVGGNPSFECGARGLAVRFDGVGDYVYYGGTITNEFDREDFTISFYFKPKGSSGTQTLISTVQNCPAQNFFAVKYEGNTRLLTVQMVESATEAASINRFALPSTSCWHHIAVVRSGTKTQLYVNGEFAIEVGAQERIDIRNMSTRFTLAQALCPGSDRNFEGLIDEVRVYNRALKTDEIEELYYEIDKITTPDTRIFLGESVDVEISNTCSGTFRWTGGDGISDPNIVDPLLSPTETTTYTLSFTEDGCPQPATDTIRIVVIDPETIDCQRVFLPKAFTPNGDNLNDTYGISNPEIFIFGDGELISFEIFDRWGNLVFATTDADIRWDGSYKGKAVNPGVMLYKVSYRCDNEEKIESGSVTILR